MSTVGLTVGNDVAGIVCRPRLSMSDESSMTGSLSRDPPGQAGERAGLPVEGWLEVAVYSDCV